jgi:hypothetical protein
MILSSVVFAGIRLKVSKEAHVHRERAGFHFPVVSADRVGLDQ